MFQGNIWQHHSIRTCTQNTCCRDEWWKWGVGVGAVFFFGIDQSFIVDTVKETHTDTNRPWKRVQQQSFCQCQAALQTAPHRVLFVCWLSSFSWEGWIGLVVSGVSCLVGLCEKCEFSPDRRRVYFRFCTPPPQLVPVQNSSRREQRGLTSPYLLQRKFLLAAGHWSVNMLYHKINCVFPLTIYKTFTGHLVFFIKGETKYTPFIII